MRIIYSAAVCAALCLPAAAVQAQDKVTVSGASAAGLCAAAMEFVAGARSASGVAQDRELIRLGKIRDTLLNLPQFPKGEVEAYAVAWSARMAENVASAQSQAKLNAIAKDIGSRARKCQQGMVQSVNDANAQGGTQPLATQPYTPAPAQ